MSQPMKQKNEKKQYDEVKTTRHINSHMLLFRLLLFNRRSDTEEANYDLDRGF